MMKEKFLTWARSFEAKKLAQKLSLAAFVLDILNAIYFVQYFKVQNLAERAWIMSLRLRGENWSDLDELLRLELIGVANQTAGMMILTILIVNIFFYLYLSHHKHWAWQYVQSYAWGAVGLTLLTLMEGFPVGGAWEIINLSAIPCYSFLALMCWARKKDFNKYGFYWKEKKTT
jgi:hypothetical protein